MITSIAQLLIARKPNPPAEWLQKLPQMARRLEESLFRSAASFEEYRDRLTLLRRLQALTGRLAAQQQQQAAGPAPASPPAPSLNIRLHKVPEGDEVWFKVKTTTKLQRLFDTYALHKGIGSGSLRFLLDGKRLNGDQTPEDVDVEDGDQIDVFEDAFSASLRAAKRPRSSPRQV